jgi:monoamine oxidase
MADPRHDVIVVGAGLAGLACADDLAAAGLDVVVLESRDRVGGRVFTHRFDGDGSDEQWVELGAEFVDDAHREVWSLADRLGIASVAATADHDDRARLLDIGGRTAPFAAHGSLGIDLDRWDDALDELADRVEPSDPTGGADAAELDATPLSALIAGLDLSVVARVVVGRDVRSEFMVPPEELSQLFVGWITALHRRSGDGYEGHRLVGGADRLATGLADGLGDRVRLGARVTWVEPDDGALVLDTGERLTADHLVVTVPLPVLSRLWPAMPTELSGVAYGRGGKVCVQTRRRLWHDDGRDGSVRTERSWGELWDATDGLPGDAGVLTALLASHDGAALVALPGCVDHVVGEIDRIFPGTKGLVRARVRHDWSNDPDSLGTYVAFAPGQLVPAWPLLRQPHGRMLLAGEHTDEWCGYMEGALRSGRRAARSITGS